MDQKKINIVTLKILQKLLNGSFCPLVTRIRYPEPSASSDTRFTLLAPLDLPLWEKKGITVFPEKSYSSRKVQTGIGKSYHHTGYPT